MEVLKLKKIIERTLDQNKAQNIVAISLKGKSSIADYMIIASGNSSRHIQSLSETIVKKLGEKGKHPRSVLAVLRLPQNAPVMIDLRASIKLK